MSLFEKPKELLGLLTGGPMAIVEAADAASGGHIKDFKTSLEKLDAAIGEDTRDAALEAMHLAGYNGTRIRVIVEVLRELVEGMEKLETRWAQRSEPKPEVRDAVNAVAVIADDYVSVPPPRRQILMTALRGSFDPELFLWGLQDELLRRLVEARLGPEDIEVLKQMKPHVRPSMATTRPHKWEEPPPHPIESMERLARSGFIEIRQPANDTTTIPRFIKSRHEATTSIYTLNITTEGQRLLQMLDAGK